MKTSAASTRRLSSLGLVVVALLVLPAAPVGAAGRDIPGGIGLPPVRQATSVLLHTVEGLASLVLDELSVRIGQEGIHVTLLTASSNSGDCFGIKVVGGEFELRFGHTEFSIDAEGIELEIGIERIELAGIKIKTKTPVSACDWSGAFGVGGAASDIKLKLRIAPRVRLDDCGVLGLGDFSARVTIGDLNMQNVNNELDKLLKNIVEDSVTNALNLLVPDTLTGTLEDILAVDLCQSKWILYQAYMAALGAGVALHKLPEETVRQLQSLYPTADLEGVRFGHRWQPMQNNTTDCSTIYFSDEGTVARLRNGLDLDGDEWSLLFHELQHVEQCAQLGGRRNFAERWFRDLSIAVLVTNLSDPVSYVWQLHDNMPMEQEADARANEIVVIKGTVRNESTGEAVGGIRVGAYVAGTPVRGFGAPVTSDVTSEGSPRGDREGTFSFPVEIGSYDLYVWPEGSRIQRLALEDVDANAGVTIRLVTIEVDANGVPAEQPNPVTAATFRRGDVNASGDLNIADALFTLGWLFINGPAPSCEDAADANDDGRIDISDPLAVLGFLFLGGVTLPAPVAAPGVDPTADSLGCAVSQA